jgi:hypothetical protein
LDPPNGWDDIFGWSRNFMRGKNLHAIARKLYLAAALYNIWIQRNAFMHNGSPRTEEALLSKIRWEVKVRLLSKASQK